MQSLVKIMIAYGTRNAPIHLLIVNMYSDTLDALPMNVSVYSTLVTMIGCPGFD